MNIDYVHDIQRAFRKVVRAFSFPGVYVSLADDCRGVDEDLGLPPVWILLALMLLDSEVTFSVVDADAPSIEKMLSRLTYSRAVLSSEADFIFVPDYRSDSAPAILSARCGNLVSPELGATLVLGIAPEDAGLVSSTLRLDGPGIQGTRLFSAGCHSSWVEARSFKNKEYPLGIDMIFAGPTGKVAALPRTSRIAVAQEVQ